MPVSVGGARPPWTLRPDGLDLRVRVTPRGGRDALEGVDRLADGRAVLRVRVRATPEGGAANAAVGDLVHDLLRRRLRCPRETVSVTAGATGRVKTLRVIGEGGPLAAALAAALSSPETDA